MEVGFIGLGDQGYPMAHRIGEAGWPLTVWARRPGVAETLAGVGATVAPTPAELAEGSDLIGICVTADDEVVEVVEALQAGFRSGAAIAIHSSVTPATCHRVAEQVAPFGVTVLDAPVSGGRPRAMAGTLTVMVGGDRAAFERVKPVFESFGTPEYLGALGSAQTMKALNNAMLMAHLELACDAIQVAAELGLDPGVTERVLLEGSGGSFAMRSRIRFRELDLDHVRANLTKDLGLFQRAAGSLEAASRIEGLGRDLLDRMTTGKWM